MLLGRRRLARPCSMGSPVLERQSGEFPERARAERRVFGREVWAAGHRLLPRRPFPQHLQNLLSG